ncbi:MAG: carboxypeptidase-like regulatory domain-containing protein [Bryobacterales bacterium]|nr:carboxypeptidase-like regulatory domain-containing protein [Bryobacterales bacterium]
MRTRLAISISALLCFMLCLAAPSLLAQSTQSSIVGAVTDPSGAGIAGASVQVISQSTGYVREIQSGAQGDYRVSGVEPGLYRVVVTAPGFEALELKDVDVVSGQVKRADASLKVGEVTTTITVEGGISQIDTESATLSNVKTARDFTEQPLSVMGRGWANIVTVLPECRAPAGLKSTERETRGTTSRRMESP